MRWKSLIFLIGMLGVWSSLSAQVWNNPHRSNAQESVFYSAILGPPKTLDPARAYSSDEITVIAQIYEPVLQYSYLKRPYRLELLTATRFPRITAQGGYTTYDIYLKPHIYYQPHPAFAKNANGEFLYHHLNNRQLSRVRSLSDFQYTGSRELKAEDYIYEIKRIASPQVQSPIFGIMSKYILGLKQLNEALQKAVGQCNNSCFIDLRKYPLDGLKLLGPYHFQIKIHGSYPQFKYWLAMTFFSPIPWEADEFYSQPKLKDHNITLSWYPVGTGPYMIVENNPNKEIVLAKNPNFHNEFYPRDGSRLDRQKGYLFDAGRKLPFIDKAVFELDKESIPRWNKFLQGYYDYSGVGEDSFNQAIKISDRDHTELTDEMKRKGIRLDTTVEPGIYYIGFNMKDPIVGGYTDKQRKLRQAIAIALDEEEYIAIFLNGRGIPAQGPIPPGIFGHETGRAGTNSYVYNWVNGKRERKSLDEARKLLAEAGYPNGIDPATGKGLILNYDTATTGNPDDKSYFDWLRQQFQKLGIQLNIRATLYNRFQDKVLQGKVQIFSWGWLADYPDPENFYFLLYGPNGKATYGGENATNYENPEADKLFEEIRLMPNSPARLKKINSLLAIVRRDSPWIWGFYPITFTLSHQWLRINKPNAMARNVLKYERVDPILREELQKKWNRPIIYPLGILILSLLFLILIVGVAYYLRNHEPTVKKMK